MKKLFTLIVFTTIYFGAQAQSYFNDSTFNYVGYDAFSLSNFINGDRFNNVLLNNGSIYFTGVGNSTYEIVAKYSCGKIDSTYSADGKIVNSYNFYDIPYTSTFQNDGKLVLAGLQSASNAYSQFTCSVSRYNTDGSIDTSFNHTGFRSEQIDGLSSDEFRKVFSLPNGKILCVGLSSNNANGGTKAFIATRYNNDGSYDASYGNFAAGKARMTNSVSYVCGGAVLGNDSSLTIAAHVAPNAVTDTIMLGRFSATGQPDNTFGVNGILHTQVTLRFSPNCIWRAAGNKMLFIGLDATVQNVVICRCNNDGSIDNSFGTNGIDSIITPYYMSDYNGPIQNPDGSFLIATHSSNQDRVFIKLNADGTPDNSFGTNGVLVLNSFTQADQPQCGMMMNDGRIIFDALNSINNGSSVIARITTSSFLPQPITYSGGVLNSNISGVSYQWTLSSTPISGATSSTYTPTENGDYRVIITYADGCSYESNEVAVNDVPNGIDETVTPEINVYPNPANDVLTVTGLSNSNTIKIYDALGRIVLTINNRNQKNSSINISSFTNGIYSLNILNEDGSNQNFKIVKIK